VLVREYSAIKSEAFSSGSGGIDGRPSLAYILSNVEERSASASSASRLIVRSGCAVGIRSSRPMNAGIVI
jgi:hypothetical protein